MHVPRGFEPITDADSEHILPDHNDQYGVLLGRRAIDDGRNTYQVAVLYDERGDQLVYDARSIWYRYGDPRYGKGFRITLAGGMAKQLLDESAELIDKVKSAFEALVEGDNDGSE